MLRKSASWYTQPKTDFKGLIHEFGKISYGRICELFIRTRNKQHQADFLDDCEDQDEEENQDISNKLDDLHRPHVVDVGGRLLTRHDSEDVPEAVTTDNKCYPGFKASLNNLTIRISEPQPSRIR